MSTIKCVVEELGYLKGSQISNVCRSWFAFAVRRAMSIKPWTKGVSALFSSYLDCSYHLGVALVVSHLFKVVGISFFITSRILCQSLQFISLSV